MSVRPDDHLLEVGCGAGWAGYLIAPRLRNGTYFGIDQSSAAIRQAGANIHECLSAGNCGLMATTLAGFVTPRRFSKVFAINVNVFWRHPARELHKVGELLLPDGKLLLIYEPPAAAQIDKISRSCQEHLEAAEFRLVNELRSEVDRRSLLMIQASPNA